MNLWIEVVSFHKIVVDVHRTPIGSVKVMINLLVVSIVEGAIRYSHISFEVMSVAVLSVAVQQRQCRDKVSFLQKVAGVGQF